jgi:hypothetical protein
MKNYTIPTTTPKRNVDAVYEFPITVGLVMWIISSAVVYAFAAVGMCIFIFAYLLPSKTVLVGIDWYGEAQIELIILVLLGVPGIAWHLYRMVMREV